MKKYLILVLLALAGCCYMNADSSMNRSGKCGSDIEWKFNNGTLILLNVANRFGFVEIPNYDTKENKAPWIKLQLPVKKVVISGTINKIGSCAFANCETLESVEFNDLNMTEIGWGAFYNCKKLFAISIPSRISHIGAIAFANCESLTSVVIPQRVRIDDQAFLSCTSLKYIEIGDYTTLGKSIFATAVVENGHTTHKLYNGEIRSLPRNINTDNCAEHGLDPAAVAICRSKEVAAQKDENPSTLDINIPCGDVVRNNTYALIIGNEDYRFVPDVPYAYNDATVFSEYCKITLGIPANNIHLCKDATKHMLLEQELGDWIEKGISNKDNKRLIVYYAGHGVPDLNDHNKAYLLPVDVYGSRPQYGIAIDDFYAKLGEYGFDLVTVFLDACFSGVTRTNDGVNAERATEVEAQESNPVKGKVVVFSAAHGTETAQGYRDQGHGLFTYHLLKELNESEGVVSYGKLSRELKKGVSEQAPSLDLQKPQTPTTASSLPEGTWKQYQF